MHWLYSTLLALSLLVSLPYWLVQMTRHGKYRAGLRERFGRVPAHIRADERPTIWLHAVSVGEVLAVSRLAHGLRDLFPNHRLLISTTTSTGQKLAKERFGTDNVFYFPLDFPFALTPYIERIKPNLVVVAETEFWPNFLRLAHAAGARIAVVNARISDRSLRGYKLLRPWLSRVLSCVDLFLAQTELDRKRLAEIGAKPERTELAGNLKFDVLPLEMLPIVASLRKAFDQANVGPVIVCGSTVDGEEPLLLRAFEIVLGDNPRAVMILAPRQPQRFQQVSELLASLGIPNSRRSLWSGDNLAGGVLLLDSIGELASVYSLADLAFVGGSLVEHGGHNILEPAQYGVPVIVGPHYENFREIVNQFRAADAVRVAGPAELPLIMAELANDKGLRTALGERARLAVRGQMGATERTLAALEQLLASQKTAPIAKLLASSDSPAR
jgi:3-deoxy-D-manno-octulosonic-acid transferase